MTPEMTPAEIAEAHVVSESWYETVPSDQMQALVSRYVRHLEARASRDEPGGNREIEAIISSLNEVGEKDAPACLYKEMFQKAISLIRQLDTAKRSARREASGRVKVLEETLTLVSKGIRSRHIEDQTIIYRGFKLKPLSKIIEHALAAKTKEKQ